MRFFADECCDAALVVALRDEGYDVVYAAEDFCGDTDDVILDAAFAAKRILITEDKDFGELVYRLRKKANGIILVRITIKERKSKWQRLKKLIDNYPDRLPGNFIVIDAKKFRFRPLLFKV